MRTLPVLAVAMTAALTLGACGGADDDKATTTSSPTADVGKASAATPVDDKTLAAAKQEGTVLLYTNAEDQQIRPVKKAFEKAFPGITLRALSLDDEMFDRYKTEVATGADTADALMSSDAVSWLKAVDDGSIADYQDANAPHLPDYAVLAPGVYAMSEDPVVAVYNKALLPEAQQPTSMTALAEMGPRLDGKIGTLDIENAVGYGAVTAYLDKHGDEGWKTLEALGEHAKVESNVGPLVTKLAQGQYAADFFVSGAVRAFIVGDVAKVVDYRYLSDGTPLLPRAIGVTAKAAHPNAAKVFVNWLLSVPGQEAACAGGFTPYRDGVKCDFGLPQVVDAIGGEDNLIVGTFDQSLADDKDATIARWDEAFGR